MKIIDAKTEMEIQTSNAIKLLIDEYKKLWIANYGSNPKGMHPIPSNVPEHDVLFFIVFS